MYPSRLVRALGQNSSSLTSIEHYFLTLRAQSSIPHTLEYKIMP